MLTIPSACEPVKPYLPTDVHLIQFETNRELAKQTGINLSSFSSIPVSNASVDRILCLASLHHATPEERRAFYTEARRILRPGGKLIIGDVEAGSPLASWLNVFVDQHNPYGHTGIFFTEQDAQLLSACGFTNVEMNLTSYDWTFSTPSQAILFTRDLFMLNCSDEDIRKGLTEYLKYTGSAYTMGLLYFIESLP